MSRLSQPHHSPRHGYGYELKIEYLHSIAISLILGLNRAYLGRYLEKKIKKFPMLLLIEIMGIVSNVFYMVISTFVCSHPAHSSTYGFSRKLIALLFR
jgi:amino acid permease